MPISINGTTGISGVDGSAAAPALQGTDTNTGIAFGSDVIIGSTGGTERFRCDSSGRVLVGTSSAYGSAVLQAVGYAGSPANTGYVSVIHGGNAGSGEDVGLLEFRDTRGAFGSIKLAVDGTTGTNDYPGRLVFSVTADGASSPTERMRINSLGRVLLNNAIGQDPWAATGSVDAGAYFGAGDNFGLAVNSRSIPLLVNRTNTTGTIQEFKYNGSITGYITTSASAITITYSSDYRLKENVIPLTNAISRIKQLQPKRFNYIVEPEITVDGFLAHEAQNVVPEAVVGTYNQVDDNGDPVYQGIDPSKMVPLLTAALQEAVAKIESLEARLTAAGI